MKRRGGVAYPPLDLDGKVEMQGGDFGEAEPQPNNRLEGTDEPTLPTLACENKIDMQEGNLGAGRGRSEGVENEIDMQEGVTREKRGQSEFVENPGNGKLRRREGIKQGLRVGLVTF